MLRLTLFAVLFAVAIQAQERTPVVLELFTSEGCSSCPAADSLLAEVEKKQPIPNVDVIVLSEHVDYWNQLGWKDPFSSSLFSERQQAYATMANSNDVYTPEAVVDGRFATVGSNRQNVMKALLSSGATPKPELKITVIRSGNTVMVEAPAATHGDTWVALAEARVVSHVAGGENGGRTLQHVGVVRSLKKSQGQTKFTIDKNWTADLRVVAFVQDAHTGRILQAVQKGI